MKLLTLGINHKTAPIELRERVALAPQVCAQILKVLKKSTGCREAVIVSTCNRTELYLAGFEMEVSNICQIWADFCKLSQQEILLHLYAHHHENSTQHLFRVACGLDSLVLGEPQVLGQLKDAYALSQQEDMLGKYLNHQFQYAFQVAKKVRTETKIGTLTVSVAYTAVQLAKQIFEHLSQETVLLIGAGETIELVARHLIEAGVKKIIIANRTRSRVDNLIHALAIDPLIVQITAIELAQIDSYLHLADITIASTGAAHPHIFQNAVKNALKLRKHKPMFMVDLAVPRDIDENISQLEDIYLYTIDDLENIIQDNQAARLEAARQAETIVSEAVSEWLDWKKIATQSNLIQAFSDEVETVRQQALNSAYKQLKKGITPEKILEQMSKQLCNKLNHAPLSVLKAAINEQDDKHLEFIKSHLIRH